MVATDLRQKLEKVGQEHLIKFYDELPPTQQKELLQDIEQVDFEQLNAVYKKATETDMAAWEYVPPSIAKWESATARKTEEKPEKCVLTRLGDVKPEIADAWRQRGYSLIASGKVGCLVMAGGQGTRLGWDRPKGTYPIGAISGKSLFQLFAERLQTIGKLAQKAANAASPPKIPFYVMTATHNHQATMKFFQDRNYWGLSPETVTFFQQQTIPSLDMNGKVLLDEKNKLCRNPNGNGGIFGSLEKSGALADMEKKGLVGIHVFGVDNALTKVLDPVFIGYVDTVGAEVGNKCTFKTNSNEKVGMMCRRHLKDDPTKEDCCVVEYSELPDDMRNARCTTTNTLLFSAGNVCNHYFRVDFMKSLVQGQKLELLHPHIAHKKIPHIDVATGSRLVPTSPNGIKIEFFIFDSFLFATRVAGLESAREEDFSPVKNAEGEDSPAMCRIMMSDLYKKWFQNHKIVIRGEGLLEVSPLVSYGGEGLEGRTECTLPAYIY